MRVIKYHKDIDELVRVVEETNLQDQRKALLD